MRSVRCDVLVVGAGPAGSAAATGMARAGLDVLLVEARSHPRAKACAEYASPMITEELRRIGLPDELWQPAAQPLRGMRVIRGGAAAEIGYRDAVGPRQAWGVERTMLDATLACHAEASGARLLERTTLTDLGWQDGRPTHARLRSGDAVLTASFGWLIGADGARSRVAETVGVARTAIPRRLGLVAHYEGVPDLVDHGEMHIGSSWYVGLAPLTGGRLNVGMALPAGGPRRSADQRFAAAVAGLPAVADRLRGRRRLTPIRGASPIGSRVSRAAGPGWMLVGDAAGFIDPFTGEGIYRALRSARAATEALSPCEAGADLRYVTARRRAFAAKDALTWVVQGMLAARPLMGYALRRLAVRQSLAQDLGSALGDCRPASDVLSPAYLARVLWP